jgi:2-amino-4-hydroxy-6-hydroxymethyldihydropteridine diphosphokinase
MAGELPCFNLPFDALVFLGLGTNLGDREQNLRAALERLRQIVEVEVISRIYESEPVGYLEQPDFWNLVLRIRTNLEPAELFRRVKQIERDLGRTDAFRNAPRLIDIDILAFDQLVLHDDQLDIPHARLHERSFVLLPLAEIAPEFRHPETNATVNEMISARELTRATPLPLAIA